MFLFFFWPFQKLISSFCWHLTSCFWKQPDVLYVQTTTSTAKSGEPSFWEDVKRIQDKRETACFTTWGSMNQTWSGQVFKTQLTPSQLSGLNPDQVFKKYHVDEDCVSLQDVQPWSAGWTWFSRRSWWIGASSSIRVAAQREANQIWLNKVKSAALNTFSIGVDKRYVLCENRDICSRSQGWIESSRRSFSAHQLGRAFFLVWCPRTIACG